MGTAVFTEIHEAIRRTYYEAIRRTYYIIIYEKHVFSWNNHGQIFLSLLVTFPTEASQAFASHQADVDETLEAMQHKLDGQRWGCQDAKSCLNCLVHVMRANVKWILSLWFFWYFCWGCFMLVNSFINDAWFLIPALGFAVEIGMFKCSPKMRTLKSTKNERFEDKMPMKSKTCLGAFNVTHLYEIAAMLYPNIFYLNGIRYLLFVPDLGLPFRI